MTQKETRKRGCNRGRLATALLTAAAIGGGALPAAAAAEVSVTQADPNSDVQTVLAEFPSAKCRNRNGGFRAVAKADGWQLEVISIIKPKRSQQLRYKRGITVRLDGPNGEEFSSNFAPAAGAGRAAGALVFNRRRTRMGIGFSPMFARDFSNVDVGGGLRCRYPKKRAAATAQAARTRTRLTISAAGGSISGFVFSTNESCHPNRRVAVYKLRRGGKSKNRSRDRLVGTDTATPNGDRGGSQYRVNVEKSGKYYAYVRGTGRCRSAFSKVVRATFTPPDDNPPPTSTEGAPAPPG